MALPFPWGLGARSRTPGPQDPAGALGLPGQMSEAGGRGPAAPPDGLSLLSPPRARPAPSLGACSSWKARRQRQPLPTLPATSDAPGRPVPPGTVATEPACAAGRVLLRLES